MTIDLKDVLPLINISDLSEGVFNIDIQLSNDRMVTLIGEIKFIGKVAQSYCVEPYFRGGAEVSLLDWIGYDSQGNEIAVENIKWFERNLANELS